MTDIEKIDRGQAEVLDNRDSRSMVASITGKARMQARQLPAVLQQRCHDRGPAIHSRENAFVV